MAKSAFLKNPSQECWMDLVHSFRMQRKDDDDDDGMEDSDEDENDDVHSWANFDQEMMNANDVAGWSSGTTPVASSVDDGLDKNEKSSNNNENWEENVGIDSALARLENSIASLEEKALHLLHIDNWDDGKSDSSEECWEEERDVSPSLLPMKEEFDSSEECLEEQDVSPPSFPMEEESSSCSVASTCIEYDPDTLSLDSEEEVSVESEEVVASHVVDEDANEDIPPAASPPKLTKTTTRTIILTPKTTKAKTYVLNEVQQLEERIVQFDQKYVNIVAAALDEAQGVADWKVGQIVEVVPSSFSLGGNSLDGFGEDGGGGDEEVLYVV